MLTSLLQHKGVVLDFDIRLANGQLHVWLCSLSLLLSGSVPSTPSIHLRAFWVLRSLEVVLVPCGFYLCYFNITSSLFRGNSIVPVSIFMPRTSQLAWFCAQAHVTLIKWCQQPQRLTGTRIKPLTTTHILDFGVCQRQRCR